MRDVPFQQMEKEFPDQVSAGKLGSWKWCVSGWISCLGRRRRAGERANSMFLDRSVIPESTEAKKSDQSLFISSRLGVTESRDLFRRPSLEARRIDSMESITFSVFLHNNLFQRIEDGVPESGH